MIDYASDPPHLRRQVIYPRKQMWANYFIAACWGFSLGVILGFHMYEKALRSHEQSEKVLTQNAVAMQAQWHSFHQETLQQQLARFKRSRLEKVMDSDH